MLLMGVKPKIFRFSVILDSLLLGNGKLNHQPGSGNKKLLHFTVGNEIIIEHSLTDSKKDDKMFIAAAVNR